MIPHDGIEFLVRPVFGLPVLLKREAVPDEGFSWRWGRWRLASFTDLLDINLALRATNKVACNVA